MSHYKQQIIACDFFTLETLFLQTLYVFFFIDLGTRRVQFAGCTAHLTDAWVTQQARQLCWELEERKPMVRYLLHNHDTKFPTAFDQVFAAQQYEVIRTPIRTPNANTFAERWVGSVRQECLKHLLIVNERHLKAVLLEYTGCYNRRRPHQRLRQHFPEPDDEIASQGAIRRRDILGGTIHD